MASMRMDSTVANVERCRFPKTYPGANVRAMIFRHVILCLGSAFLLAACDKAPSKSENVEKTSGPVVAMPEQVSFNEHIQPILSEYCYHCHGPDPKTRAPEDAPLRLDQPDGAFALRDDGRPVIIKGRPAESNLMKRMLSGDPDLIMPPPESHKTLDADKIALIGRWIEQGAEYEDHWSFVPIQKSEPPEAGASWSANPIDRFVAEKLDAVGLTPNAPDDPRRFHRRLGLDLTGLPPAPGETERFIAAYEKSAQAAVEAEADRMLQTTASAEHFTRHWLDAARYADTHGIHIDNYRAIWPYRDWVIRAFEANMPWDQFTTEQIAGDLLPERTLDQLVATGFSRCLATTGEGGAIDDEYFAIYAKDRVETVSAIWLGLTTGCAACHDHKFDPVSTKEFYSLTAFFRNTPMTALDKNEAGHPPNVFVPSMEDRPRWAELTDELAAINKQLAERKRAAHPAYDTWAVNAVVKSAPEIDSTLAIHLPLNDPDGPLRGIIDGRSREWPVDLMRVDGPLGKAPIISGKTVDLGDLGGFSRSDQVSYGGFIHIKGKPTGAVVARMNPEESNRGWDLYLQAGRPASHVIDSWDKSANKILAKEPLKSGEWHHVMVTFDGSISGHQAGALYIDGKRADSTIDPNTVGGNIETSVPLRLGARHHDDEKLTGQVAIQDFRFYRRLLSAGEIDALAKNRLIEHIASLPAGERTRQQNEALHDYYLTYLDSEYRSLLKKRDALKTEERKLRSRGSVTLVMKEKKDEPFAHVLTRGVYTDLAEKVAPDTPAVLPPMPADAPKNRLGLARWLNDPANPLPARVTMNRTWYYFFGTGIVESNDDFGIMGSRPSHPKLLDWLAAEFIDSGWDYRHMLKLIATSATYRQSGRVTPRKLEMDPANRLLARGPRHRLDAEQIRDLALASSGLLSAKTGGPPVRPYQPDGIWEAVAMPQSNTKDYRADSGESLYRRSLYTIWKRTAAPPSMEILNAPTRETFCVRRDRTNTPLQALVLLNDPQFVEASRVLATKALRQSADFGTRLDFISSRLVARRFEPDERTMIRKALDAALEQFRAAPDDAAKLVSTGETPAPEHADVPELAAWTLMASLVLNLDETLTR